MKLKIWIFLLCKIDPVILVKKKKVVYWGTFDKYSVDIFISILDFKIFHNLKILCALKKKVLVLLLLSLTALYLVINPLKCERVLCKMADKSGFESF